MRREGAFSNSQCLQIALFASSFLKVTAQTPKRLAEPQSACCDQNRADWTDGTPAPGLNLHVSMAELFAA